MNDFLNLETNRTLMRKLVANDAENLYLLNLDKEVIKYTGDNSFESIETARIFIENYKQYVNYGVGRLAVIEKTTHKFIGWCGLKFSPTSQEYDIGFRFFRQYWNKGFATETASKCMELAFNELKISRIIGRAMAENIASIKVLEKLGMNYKSTIDFDGNQGVIYEISQTDYQKKSPQNLEA